MNENKMKKSNKIYNYLFWVFLLVFVISTGFILKDKYIEWKAHKELEELGSMITTETESDTEITETESSSDEIEVTETETEEKKPVQQSGVKIPNRTFDWAALKKKCEHIIAWIYIPGTNVNYPIMWHPDDDDYYLNHNLDGTIGMPGNIFIQSTVNGTDFTDNMTLIYGHNTKDEHMFHQVLQYQNRKFFDTYRYIFIYTPEKTFAYDVFTEYIADDTHIYYEYGTYNKSGYQDYLDFLDSLSELESNKRENVEVTSDDRIISLCTCLEWGDSPYRYLVHAVLVKEVENN